MKLKNKTSVKISSLLPFNFDATFHKPDHFTTGDNYWETGIRWQTWVWQGTPLGLKFTPNKVDIWSLEKPSKDFIDSLMAEIHYRYNLNLDLTDFYNQFGFDKVLGPIIEKWRGMRPGHPSSLYEYLIIGVVLQNATIRRSIQMFKALLENYGTKLEYDNKELWCYWTPGRLAKVPEQEL